LFQAFKKSTSVPKRTTADAIKKLIPPPADAKDDVSDDTIRNELREYATNEPSRKNNCIWTLRRNVELPSMEDLNAQISLIYDKKA
jgi:hypothetical protein